MKVFLVIWNIALTITLVVLIMLSVTWSGLVGDYAANLQEWLENDFETTVKQLVDKRMAEYAEIIIKEVIKASVAP